MFHLSNLKPHQLVVMMVVHIVVVVNVGGRDVIIHVEVAVLQTVLEDAMWAVEIIVIIHVQEDAQEVHMLNFKTISVMENELLFEYLINQQVSKCIRWADLYRGASAVDAQENHDDFKVGEVHVCLLIALNKLYVTLPTGEKKEIVKKHIDTLHTSVDFDIINDIITDLHNHFII